MSTVYMSGGMLRLVGSWNVVNEMSFKPTVRTLTATTLHWGRVNEFKYSIPCSSVKALVVMSNKNDKVWVDNPFNVPVTKTTLITPVPEGEARTADLRLLQGYHAPGIVRVRVDYVDCVLPFKYQTKVQGSSSSSSSSQTIVLDGSILSLFGIGHFYLKDTWDETVSKLAAVGWGQNAVQSVKLPLEQPYTSLLPDDKVLAGTPYQINP